MKPIDVARRRASCRVDLRCRAFYMVVLVLVSSIACADSNEYFSSWPEGASPREIGGRVAERFLASRDHMLWAEYGTLHYAEVATWYGALTFSRLADDEALRAAWSRASSRSLRRKAA